MARRGKVPTFRSREWALARLKEVPGCPIATRIVIATETADDREMQRGGLNHQPGHGDKAQPG